jgi:hypothetical protein
MSRGASPSSYRGCHRSLLAKRLPVMAVVVITSLGAAACGSDDEPPTAASGPPPACQRLRRVLAEVRDDPQPGDPVRQAQDVLAALGDGAWRRLPSVPPGERVPRAVSGPASVLARAASAPKAEVEDALVEVSRWFGVECVGPTEVDGPEDRRLLAHPPPGHLPICWAMDTAEVLGGSILRPDPGAGQWAAWGDASAPDPWSGTVVSLATSHGDHVPVHEGAVPATVRGRSALVAPAPLFQAVSSPAWGHVVSWQERPGLVAEAAFRRGSPADVLRVAEQVRFDGDRPYLPGDALGPRTDVLFDGIPPTPLGIDQRELWSVAYGTGQDQIRVLGRAPVDHALRALEFWTVRSERLTVRGQAAILYAAFEAESGPWGVAWTEPDGPMVQVVGFARREEVIELASSLLDVSPAEWRAAKAEGGHCADDAP